MSMSMIERTSLAHLIFFPGAGITIQLQQLNYAKRIEVWKAKGYSIEIVYIRLPSPQLALRRVAARVKQGGHNVTRKDVLRRYSRSWANFLEVYRPLADDWTIYENSVSPPKLLEHGP
jgi:predicted ABC-type ATPase